MRDSMLNRLLRPLASMTKNLQQYVLTARELLPLSPGFRWVAASIVLCLLLLLTLSGCAPQTKTVRPPLPSQAQPRLVPDFTGSTHRDVLMYAIELREGWLSCESEKGVWRHMHERQRP